jgi:mannitol 2-dehydrogenase
MQDEISPLIPPVPGWDMTHYHSTLLSRLMNPHISDQLSRLAARGSVKMPAYLLPSLHEARAQHRQHNLLMLAVAAWMRYLRGYDLGHRPIVVDDPRAHELTRTANLGENNPVPLLKAVDVYGDELQFDDVFIYRLGDMLRDIDRSGVERALRRNLSTPLADAVGT